MLQSKMADYSEKWKKNYRKNSHTPTVAYIWLFKLCMIIIKVTHANTI